MGLHPFLCLVGEQICREAGVVAIDHVVPNVGMDRRVAAEMGRYLLVADRFVAFRKVFERRSDVLQSRARAQLHKRTILSSTWP